MHEIARKKLISSLHQVVDLTNSNRKLIDDAENANHDHQAICNALDNVQSKNQQLELLLANEKSAKSKADRETIRLKVSSQLDRRRHDGKYSTGRE